MLLALQKFVIFGFKSPFLLQVASAFSQMLNLHNLSEDISNAHSERAARMGEV